nr:hypothetical protein [Tanacetum cinerariifolium]
HTPPDTTIADSFTPLRFIYPSLAKTSRCSEAYHRWRSALLSTLYLPTTSESSAGDSSSESSAEPSRKICRFMDSISPEDSVEEDIDTDVLAYIETNATAVERVEDIKTRHKELEARSLIAGGERASLLEHVARLRGIVMMESARADWFRQHMSFMESELRQIHRLIVEPVVSSSISINQVPHYGLNIMTMTHSSMTPKAIKELINQRMAEALAAYEANCTAELAIDSQSYNGEDDDNENVRGNGDRNGGGNGNENRGGNRNENPNRNDKGVIPVACECTCHDFMKCQPVNFKGSKGVVGLTRWRRCFTSTIVEKFIGGLSDNIQGNVIVVDPTRLQDVVRIANNLMDQKLKGYAMKNAKNKKGTLQECLAIDSQSYNGEDDDNENVRGNGDRNGGGNGNENRGGNRNENPNRNDKGVIPVARECTCHDFMKCQPINFKGSKGVVGLTRWRRCFTSTIVQRDTKLSMLRAPCAPRWYPRRRIRLRSLLEIMTMTHSSMTPKAIKELINQRLAEALAAYEANCAAELAIDSQSYNGEDDDNENVRGNGDRNGGGNGNENRGGNRNENPNRNDKGVIPVARECTCHDFMKCQPINFKGSKGVVGLTRWRRCFTSTIVQRDTKLSMLRAPCAPRWYPRRRISTVHVSARCPYCGNSKDNPKSKDNGGDKSKGKGGGKDR